MDKLCSLFRNLGNSLVLEEVLTTLDDELHRVMDYDALAVHVSGLGAGPGENLAGVRSESCLTPVYLAGTGLNNSLLMESLAAQNLVARAVALLQPVLEQFPWVTDAGSWVAAFPLELASEGIAVLTFFRLESRTLSGGDLSLLREVAPKLAAAIENTLKYRFAGAASASGHGPHLVHVRSLFRCLDAELARAKRSQTPLAVMQCSTGADVPLSVTHQQTLDFIARLFREHCREYDFTARTGDELVLILPGFRPKDIPDKLALIQQLIDAGGSLSEVPPRLVAGAAFFPDDGTDAEDLLAVAALRLHRNRQPLKTPKTDVESVDRAVNVYATQ